MQSRVSMTAPAAVAPKAVAGAETLTGALLAALLGMVLVWGVGFSHISVFHNAAHDVRHSNGFPCH